MLVKYSIFASSAERTGLPFQSMNRELHCHPVVSKLQYFTVGHSHALLSLWQTRSVFAVVAAPSFIALSRTLPHLQSIDDVSKKQTMDAVRQSHLRCIGCCITI